MRKAVASLLILSNVTLGGCAFLDKMTPDQRESVATTLEAAGGAAPVIGAAGGPIGVVGGGMIGAGLIALAAMVRAYVSRKAVDQ